MSKVGAFAGAFSVSRRRPAPPSPLWDPTDYGTLEAWYEPAYAASVNGSSPITSINDLSGNGHNLDQVSGAINTGRTLGTNNIDVLDFAPATQVKLYAISQTIQAVNTATWMIVYDRDAGANEGAWARLWAIWKPATGQDFDGTDRISAIIRNTGGGSTFGSYYNSSAIGGSTVAAGEHIIATRRNGDTWDMFIDGAHVGSQVTGLGTTNWATSVEMGLSEHTYTHDSTDGSPDGGIGDIVWWNSHLSDTDITDAMDELNVIYGIY